MAATRIDPKQVFEKSYATKGAAVSAVKRTGLPGWGVAYEQNADGRWIVENHGSYRPTDEIWAEDT